MKQLAHNLNATIWRTLAWLGSGLLMLALVIAVLVLVLQGRTVSAPDWLTERIETQLNAVSAPAQLTLDNVDLQFAELAAPQVRLMGLTVRDGDNRLLAELPEVQVDLARDALLRRQVEFRWISLIGADLSLRRGVDGSLDLTLGDGTDDTARQINSAPEALDQIDDILDQPIFRSLQGVSVEELRLSYTDSRAGRRWEVFDGLLAFEKQANSFGAQLFLTLSDELGVPSELAVGFSKQFGSHDARMSISFSDLPARDIATQSPALSFLSVIDAPISGAIRTGLTATAELMPLTASLDVGAGALNPVVGAEPIRFQTGRSRISYDPEEDRIDMHALELVTDALSLNAKGQFFPGEYLNGFPTVLVAQTQISDLVVNPADVFDAPVAFETGRVDAKIALDPFTVTLGQAILTDQAQDTLKASGRVLAREDGWRVALDLEAAQIEKERIIALWPPAAVPRTRAWVNENVLTGSFSNLHGAVRLSSEAPPRLGLQVRFEDASVQFLNTFPPIQNGRGYLSMSEKALDVVVEQGEVAAPQGGMVDVSGSVFHVGDIQVKPALGEVFLEVDSSIEGALSLLDLPPLEIMKRTQRPTDLADGQANVTAKLDIPLRKGVTAKDVGFSAEGVLRDVSSDVLVENKTLQSDALVLRLSNDAVTISGVAELDAVPLKGKWSQAIGSGAAPGSSVSSQITLSAATVEGFNLGLPSGMLSGSGVGDLVVQINKDAPPSFTLTSDLSGIGLRLPSIGWSKSPSSKGQLRVEGVLGAQPEVSVLSLSAAGLNANGSVSTTPAGELDRVTFGNVTIGQWLDAPITLIGRGAGRAPLIEVGRGVLDLRNANFGGGQSNGQSGPIRLALDRLIVSDGIQLRNVNGTLGTQGGLQGEVTATLDGGGPIAAVLAPSTHGTAIRVRSQDAGRVLRGAGIFKNSKGGALDLSLVPRAQKGEYDGRLSIDDTSVQEAPVLAGLLSAISVVGLLEQMAGQGLSFQEIRSTFRLTPDAIEITRGSAVGPSLGISLAGIYGLKTNKLDMQGVVSPIYLINGIGSIFTRRGEGLFGFNYSVKGDAKSPRVGVNPLSILTPGMFREIFRSPPPELNN